MKQTLSDVAGVWRRAAQESLFSLFRYDMFVRRKSTAAGTESGEKLRSQMNEA